MGAPFLIGETHAKNSGRTSGFEQNLGYCRLTHDPVWACRCRTVSLMDLRHLRLVPIFIARIISVPTHVGGGEMSIRVRMTILFFIVLALVPLTSAKDKKKQVLPNYVLRAQTVAVMIRPEAGEPLTSPGANRTAQINVMNAMAKWGRFRLVSDAQTADLIVAVQKGHANGPTIRNSPVDSQPITLDGGVQPADGGIPPAGVHGRSPDLTIPAWADRQVERRISATRPVCQK